MKKLMTSILGLLLSVSNLQAAPHIFNADSPVVLVQETEFATMPYHNNNGEVGTTLVVGKAVGGIGTDIAAFSWRRSTKLWLTPCTRVAVYTMSMAMTSPVSRPHGC